MDLNLEIGYEGLEKTELEAIETLRKELIEVCAKYEREIGTGLVLLTLMGFTLESHSMLEFPKDELIKIIDDVYPGE